MYASVDGGPFAPWFTNTTATSGTYVGAVGHTYGFFSVARDRVGHTEGGTVGCGSVDRCRPGMRIDRDLDVDRNDVNLILAGRGTFAAPDDPRDANKNGAIDVGDGRYCAVGCTRPGCAPN